MYVMLTNRDKTAVRDRLDGRVPDRAEARLFAAGVLCCFLNSIVWSRKRAREKMQGGGGRATSARKVGRGLGCVVG